MKHIKEEVASTPAQHTALRPSGLLEAYDALTQGFADNPSPPQNPDRGRPKQCQPKTCLNKHKAGVLAFMYDFRIPFDYNLVERDVR